MDDELAQAFGERARFARQSNRQTQAVVAGLTGITPDYLYQIERGKKLPALPIAMQRVPSRCGCRARSGGLRRL